MIDYDLILVDVDGVIWIDEKPIKDNIDALKKIANSGIEIMLLTNNSTRSRRSYSRRMREIGLDISPNRIVNSGYSVSSWIRHSMGESRVLVIGEEGLIEELHIQGHEVLNHSDYRQAEVVVVGLDRSLTYRKLETGAWAIRNGAKLVAANRDNAFPTSRGLSPGAGSIVALLETATGVKTYFDAGKPNPWMLEAAYKLLGYKPGRVALIGDRIDTDMELARRAGIDGILVKTGVAARRGDPVPRWVTRVVGTLKDLL